MPAKAQKYIAFVPVEITVTENIYEQRNLKNALSKISEGYTAVYGSNYSFSRRKKIRVKDIIVIKDGELPPIPADKKYIGF